MTAAPMLTIGIPVYNGARYVREAIEASLAQTDVDLEVVVADNASTDATAEICRDLAARDPRVRYVHFDEHLGVAGSYSRTFGLCTSEYFKWAASDDLFHPTFAANALTGLRSRPDAVLCYSEAAVLDRRGQRLRREVRLRHHGAAELLQTIDADRLELVGDENLH